ncbi:MAG TPA: hypothetical protein VIY51_09970 [Xanthobacteraceae bacterium]
MTDVRHGRLSALACALAVFAIASAGAATAAPLAAELGPVVSIGESAGGYVGHLNVTPDHGPVGTAITITGTGMPAGQDIELIWTTVNGSWKAGDGEYHGRSFDPVAYRIATVKSDKSGAFSATFAAPDDFGFMHDILAQQGRRLLTQTAFNVDMTVRLLSDHGPVGTPIELEVKGIGWRELQASWMLLYDNRYTGWMSSITTHGSARVAIPAVGREGLHILEVLNSDFGSVYRNMQQSPQPDRPRFKLAFTITPGAPVLPPPAEQQLQTSVRWLLPPGDLVTTPAFSPIDRGVVTVGTGFDPGKTFKLNWTSLTGNRIIGHWEEASRTIAEAKPDASGRLEFRYHVPDDLGGNHTLWVDKGGDAKVVGTYWVAPSALPLDVARGPIGTTFKVHLKGVGWTETANIYTVVYDNGHTGYACAFNSQGDIEIFMQATGEPGWHFIDLYPAIYKGKETAPVSFRLPQLTYAVDHPAEDLPAFHFAFEVTPAVGQ